MPTPGLQERPLISPAERSQLAATQASKELRLTRFSFGTSCWLSQASASASALPGGNGNSDGSFNNVGNNGNWWSATENNASNAYSRSMDGADNVQRNTSNKSQLFSVRCIK